MDRAAPHPPARRAGLIAAGLLLGVLGCSKHDPTAPETTEALGTPITGPNTVGTFSRLLWSARTNELVCVGSGLGGTPFGLLAISPTSGSIRVLDSTMSVAVALAPGGSAVYSNALTAPGDTTVARYTLMNGGPARTLGVCTGLCVFIMEPAPDGDQVAVSSAHVTGGAVSRRGVATVRAANGEVDSLSIYRLSARTTTPLTTGTPLAFSPSSTKLLVHDPFESFASARIVTIANGQSQPAGLGVPDTLNGSLVRWDARGIDVLYISSDARHLYERRVEMGTTTLIWASPDTLDGMARSTSGAWVVLWSTRLTGAGATLARRVDLHAIDLATRTVTDIAYGTIPLASLISALKFPIAFATIFDVSPNGAIAISPDERSVAYCFDERIYRSAMPSR